MPFLIGGGQAAPPSPGHCRLFEEVLAQQLVAILPLAVAAVGVAEESSSQKAQSYLIMSQYGGVCMYALSGLTN